MFVNTVESVKSVEFIGRDGVIRTHDPMHPMHVRYQAALRPDEGQIIVKFADNYQMHTVLFKKFDESCSNA